MFYYCLYTENMDKFVVRQQHKDMKDVKSRQKIKLESDEKVKEEDEEDEFSHPVPWQKIEAEGLDCDYALLFSKEEADRLFSKLEEEVVYSTGTSVFVVPWCWCVFEWLELFVFQERKQKSMCLESCIIYQESRWHMETRV